MELSVSQTVKYLFDKHNISVEHGTVIKWMNRGHLEGWQDVSRHWFTTTDYVDGAVSLSKIPPKIGMPRTFTSDQKNRMKRMREEGHTLKEIAKKYGCDPSYVSYVYRGLR